MLRIINIIQKRIILHLLQEIIGGMLDLDHHVWRNPKKENFDQQRTKVLEFLEAWRKYDFESTNRISL